MSAQSKQLGTYFWARIGMMVLSFFAVVFLIWRLNQFSPADLTLLLCPTRVTSITLADGHGIVQDGMRWYRRNNGNLEELDPVAVEKWFAQNCKLDIEPVKKADAAGVQMVVTYVTGGTETLYRAGEGLYRWKEKTFTSKSLESAVTSLRDLPIYLRPTSR